MTDNTMRRWSTRLLQPPRRMIDRNRVSRFLHQSRDATYYGMRMSLTGNPSKGRDQLRWKDASLWSASSATRCSPRRWARLPYAPVHANVRTKTATGRRLDVFLAVSIEYVSTITAWTTDSTRKTNPHTIVMTRNV